MRRLLLAFTATMLLAQPALAQDKWPSRPIKLIVPFAAGGNTDAVARITAAQMQKALGVNVVIENKGGAGGIVGTDAAAKSAPDGYTFCVCSIGSITIAPATEKLPYDPLSDIMPISLLNTNPLILLVNPGVKANSVQELVALAKAEPDKLNYSSSGLGGLMYFSAELFKAKTGTKMTHVPYRGGAPATTAVIAGEVQLVFTNMSDAVSQLEGGKVQGARGHHLEAQPVGAERADARRAGHRRLPHRILERAVRAQGHAAAGDRAHGAGCGGDGEGSGGAEADGELRLGGGRQHAG